MVALVFDEVGQRTYEFGIDKAVIYLPDGRSFAWNGISSIEEDANREVSSYYLDGRPYLHSVTLGAFEGTLNAYTYPDIVSILEGYLDMESVTGAPGMMLGNQTPQLCNLSYRTKVGSDLDEDLGYKLHMLYNVLLVPEVKTNTTLSLSAEPTEFSWKIYTTPPSEYWAMFSHVIFDSRIAESWWLDYLENWLYGTTDDDPHFPTPVELTYAFAYVTAAGPPSNSWPVSVVDNGNGTWTATDTNGEITVVNSVFTITDVNAENVNASSYDLVVE